MLGVSEDALDLEDLDRPVVKGDSENQKVIYGYLKKYDTDNDGNLSLREVKNVNNLTITADEFF